MNMELTVRYDSEKNIYFKKIEGAVTLQDALGTLQNDGTYDMTKNIYMIEDLTRVSVGFSLKELYKFISQANKVFPERILIFHTIITRSKRNSAFVFIVKSFINKNRYKLALFSSADNAERWIREKQNIYGKLPPE